MNTDLTAPVDAAARVLFEEGRAQAAALLDPEIAAKLATWETCPPAQKVIWRDAALPLVAAAVEAIPEPPGSNVWLEGLMDGKS